MSTSGKSWENQLILTRIPVQQRGWGRHAEFPCRTSEPGALWGRIAGFRVTSSRRLARDAFKEASAALCGLFKS